MNKTETTQKIKVKTSFKIAKKNNTQTKQKGTPPPKKKPIEFILCWPVPPEQIHIVLANYSKTWCLPKSVVENSVTPHWHINNSCLGLRLCVHCCFPVLGFLFVCLCAGLMHNATVSMSFFLSDICQDDIERLKSSTISDSYNLSTFSSTWIFGPWREEGG